MSSEQTTPARTKFTQRQRTVASRSFIRARRKKSAANISRLPFDLQEAGLGDGAYTSRWFAQIASHRTLCRSWCEAAAAAGAGGGRTPRSACCDSMASSVSISPDNLILVQAACTLPRSALTLREYTRKPVPFGETLTRLGRASGASFLPLLFPAFAPHPERTITFKWNRADLWKSYRRISSEMPLKLPTDSVRARPGTRFKTGIFRATGSS